MQSSEDAASQNYRLTVNPADPYAGLIERFIVREFEPLVQSDKCVLLDLITEAIVASGQVRYGPVPSPESLVAVRDVIRCWMEKSRPIPFVVPWGSEKPSGEGVDIAELCALKTMLSLQRRVIKHYPPGIQLNIRLEDVSAPHLFFDRVEQARQEAKLYTDGFVNLVNILGLYSFIKPVPESTLVSEAGFNARADAILPFMQSHVILPDDPAPIEALKETGWTPITPPTVDYYLQCYEKLYPNTTKAEKLHRLARYLSAALARKYLHLTGDESDWSGRYLELSFMAAPPGIPSSRFIRRIFYRTMPCSITSNHMPPWRCKGYLRIGQNDVTAALASYRTPNNYNPFQIELEKRGLKQVVQADYVVL